jgi:hypothetical protein
LGIWLGGTITRKQREAVQLGKLWRLIPQAVARTDDSAAWEVVYYSNPGITDKIFDKQVEPFPVGVLITLISAVILRRK